VLGNSGRCLGHEFYQWEGLGPTLVESVFKNLHLLPDYRVKPILRILLLKAKYFALDEPRTLDLSLYHLTCTIT
jgi:hypothetical protein